MKGIAVISKLSQDIPLATILFVLQYLQKDELSNIDFYCNTQNPYGR